MNAQSITSKRTKNRLVIKINDPVDIQNIKPVYDKLIKEKFDRSEIILEVNENVSIDLSFIQLVLSLHKTHLEKNQKITLNAPLNAMQKNVILDTNTDIKIAT
mgnify:CR=1 FL=1